MQMPIVSRVPVSADARARLGGFDVRLLRTTVNYPPRQNPACFQSQWSAVRQAWSGRTRDDVWSTAAASAYAALNRQLGINPKKVPPSAVNLLIRYAIGDGARKDIRSIHPAVDAGNVVQAETLIPVAVFDASKLSGDLLLDVPRDGDLFFAFGYTEPEPVDMSRLVLRDGEGVISEFCYRDSQPTAVQAGTTRLEVVIPLAAGIDDSAGEQCIARFISLLETC